MTLTCSTWERSPSLVSVIASDDPRLWLRALSYRSRYRYYVSLCEYLLRRSPVHELTPSVFLIARCQESIGMCFATSRHAPPLTLILTARLYAQLQIVMGRNQVYPR